MLTNLRKKTQSHLRTCIRYGIGTGRIADEYNSRIFAASHMQRDSNILIVLDTGKQTTVAGKGKLYEKFLQTGEIKDFSGYGSTPAKFHQEHYQRAPLCTMSFAETYGNMHYDCRQSKIVLQV